jgi:hypothetical protein
VPRIPQGAEVTNISRHATPSPAWLSALAALGLLIAILINPWLAQAMLPEIFGNHPRRFLLAGGTHVLGILFFSFLLWRARTLAASRPARAFERIPGAVNGLLMLGSVTALFAVQELFFFLVGIPLLQEVRATYFNVTPFTMLAAGDSLLGWRGTPCAHARNAAWHLQHGTPIYDVEYQLNEHGFRVVPQADIPKQEHLAIFGCSHTFGAGCYDEETFPAQLACLRPGTQVTNFAIPGYSPAQAALQASSGTLELLPELPGAAVFVLIPDHLNRIVAGGRRSTGKSRYAPAFTLDDPGRARYLGAQGDVQPWRFTLNDFVTSLNVSKCLRLNSVFPPGPRRMQLAAAICEAARDAYVQRFPGNRFYVLVHPQFGHDQIDITTLLAELKKRDVAVLNPGPTGTPGPVEDLYFPYDKHPTPLSHARLAEWFWQQFPNGLAAGQATQD